MKNYFLALAVFVLVGCGSEQSPSGQVSPETVPEDQQIQITEDPAPEPVIVTNMSTGCGGSFEPACSRPVPKPPSYWCDQYGCHPV